MHDINHIYLTLFFIAAFLINDVGFSILSASTCQLKLLFGFRAGCDSTKPAGKKRC